MSRKLALIIGNSEYDDKSLARLVTPDTDVYALAQVLRDAEIGGFDEVVTLVNQPATAIRREVAGFFVKPGRDDLLLLYFSGHGIRDDRGQLFLAVRDTEHNLLRGTAIPAAYISEEMDNSRSRRQVLILDCCHSGAFSRGMKGTLGATVGTAAAFEGTGSGRVVLTATDSTQYAWEGDQVIGQAENSVFTRYLIQGLRTGEADTDADGQITLDELYNYVYERVVHETPKQSPGKWSYGQQGEMVIARNPRPVVKPVDLPPDLQQTIDDPRQWVREGAVRELDRLLHGSHPGLALAAYDALKRMAEDDSRRVAAVASESLAVYAAQQVSQAPAPGRDDQNRARYLKEPESNAHHRAGTVIKAAEKAAQVQQSRPQAEHTDVLIKSAIAPGAIRWSPVWFTTIMWAIAWAFGWVASENLGWYGPGYEILWVLIAAMAGLIAGLAIMQVEKSFRWEHVLVISIGWTIAMLIGSSFKEGPFGAVIYGIIRGAIGGLVTGLVVLWARRSIHWQQILMIVMGWTVGMSIGQGIGENLFYSFKDAFTWSLGLWAIPGAIQGTILAAIGSIVLFWQLSLEKPSSSTHPSDSS